MQLYSRTLAMRRDARRILIVRPSALGDVCRSVPVLASLRAGFPNATIDWIVEDRWIDAVRAHPGLSNAIPFPKRRFRSVAWNPRVMVECARWFRALHANRYDIVVDVQGLARSGLMSLATRARRRIASTQAREFSWLAATERVATRIDDHVVDAMMRIACAAGGGPGVDLRLAVPADGLQDWHRLRERLGIRGRILVIAAANRWEGKRWSAQRWREALVALAPILVSNGIESVLHIGARGEEAQVQSCVPESIGAPAQDPRLTHHVVAGQMSVAATMALIADAALVLSLDSAAAHMAVGLSVPIVSLYGASRPNIDGPYGQLRWCLHGGAGESLAARQHRDAAIGRVMMDRIQVSALVDLVSKRLAEPSA